MLNLDRGLVSGGAIAIAAPVTCCAATDHCSCDAGNGEGVRDAHGDRNTHSSARL